MTITHIIHRKKNKKTLRKMFSEINFMEQDSSKNRLALVKPNRVWKYMLLRRNYAVYTMNIKRLEQDILFRHYISYAFKK